METIDLTASDDEDEPIEFPELPFAVWAIIIRKVVESTGLASVKELRKYARVNRLFYLFARCHPDYSTASSHDDETRLEGLPETLNESQASLASLAAHI